MSLCLKVEAIKIITQFIDYQHVDHVDDGQGSNWPEECRMQDNYQKIFDNICYVMIFSPQ